MNNYEETPALGRLHKNCLDVVFEHAEHQKLYIWFKL